MAIEWKTIAFVEDVISDTAYGTSWDGVTDVAPSKNAVYDGAKALIGDGIRRNYIINGNFDIWQRGTSQTTSVYGSADRWLCYHVLATKTASRQAFTLGQTDVPDEPTYFMRHAVTTANNADEQCRLMQAIEGVRSLAGKTVLLSFYAKADAVKNIAIEFYQEFGTGGSPSDAVMLAPTKIALTTSWARYTVTVNIPSIAGKTLGTDNNDKVSACIWFSAGSNFNSRTDSLGPQSGTFDIANVALIEGSLDVAPVRRSLGEELALCQRYYYVSGSGFFMCGQTYTANSLYDGLCVLFTFPVMMRTVPTVSISEGTDGGSGSAINPVAVTATSIGIN